MVVLPADAVLMVVLPADAVLMVVLPADAVLLVVSPGDGWLDVVPPEGLPPEEGMTVTLTAADEFEIVPRFCPT